MYCMQCKQPSPDMKRAIEEEKQQRAADEGRGGGLFDRQDPNDRNAWDSDDEEVDEFGRRKKKSSAGKVRGSTAANLSTANTANTAKEFKGPRDKVDKHKAALERLRNKHAVGRDEASHASRARASRSRSRSRRW